MIYILLLSLCGLIIIVLGFFVFNLYKQNEQLEIFIKETNDREAKIYDDAEKYYLAFLHLFQKAQSEMDRIDKRGSFSSDDEVGFGFKVIHTAINNVVAQLQDLKNQANNEEENNEANDKG